MPLEERVEKAAKILNIKAKDLIKALNENGVDSIEMLDANTTTYKDLQGVIQIMNSPVLIPVIKVKAAASILKGENPFAEREETVLDSSDSTKKESETSSLATLIKSQRPVNQWSDEEVLLKYLETEDEQYESDLQRRAKGRRFVILTGNSQEVDVDASILMLKRARKEEIPSFITTEDKKTIHIYKIEEYHRENRVRYESPLRPGVTLFDGFCQVSNQNFKNVGDPARKMLRLIYDAQGKQSRMDETRLVELAEKEGVDGLARIYPEVHEQYMNLAATDSLPSLKTIAPVETRHADPFYQKSGNRTY